MWSEPNIIKGELDIDNIDLEFVCNEFDLVEHLPSDQKFIKIQDVNDFFRAKYGGEISKHLNCDILSTKLLPLNFYYPDDTGKCVNISHSEYLSDVAEKTYTVFWYPVVF